MAAETTARMRFMDDGTLRDELAELEALVEGVLDRWTQAAAPHLAGAELVWHRQEVAAMRNRLYTALERARLAAAAAADGWADARAAAVVAHVGLPPASARGGTD